MCYTRAEIAESGTGTGTATAVTSGFGHEMTHHRRKTKDARESRRIEDEGKGIF